MKAWFRRKTEPNVDSQMEEAKRAFEAGNHAHAIEIWLPLAHAGVARAQNNIGACLIDGAGVAADPVTGVKWLVTSAGNNDIVAQRNLATAYFKGTGIEQNEAEAARWYLIAAEQGDAESQDMMSWMILASERDDPDYKPDYEMALYWAKAAAKQGIASSMTRIGMMYHNALGVPRDPAQAAQWWRKAAAKGDADGQAMLGAAYLIGTGVERDQQKAMAWLILAKKGGSQLAENYYNSTKVQMSADDFTKSERLAESLLPRDGST